MFYIAMSNESHTPAPIIVISHDKACWYHGTTHAGREYALRVYSRYGNNLFITT